MNYYKVEYWYNDHWETLDGWHDSLPDATELASLSHAASGMAFRVVSHSLVDCQEIVSFRIGRIKEQVNICWKEFGF